MKRKKMKVIVFCVGVLLSATMIGCGKKEKPVESSGTISQSTVSSTNTGQSSQESTESYAQITILPTNTPTPGATPTALPTIQPYYEKVQKKEPSSGTNFIFENASEAERVDVQKLYTALLQAMTERFGEGMFKLDLSVCVNNPKNDEEDYDILTFYGNPEDEFCTKTASFSCQRTSTGYRLLWKNYQAPTPIEEPTYTNGPGQLLATIAINTKGEEFISSKEWLLFCLERGEALPEESTTDDLRTYLESLEKHTTGYLGDIVPLGDGKYGILVEMNKVMFINDEGKAEESFVHSLVTSPTFFGQNIPTNENVSKYSFEPEIVLVRENISITTEEKENMKGALADYLVSTQQYGFTDGTIYLYERIDDTKRRISAFSIKINGPGTSRYIWMDMDTGIFYCGSYQDVPRHVGSDWETTQTPSSVSTQETDSLES